MTIPELPIIPPFAPTPNITPFTYRDGATYLQILEGMRVWLNNIVLPAINQMAEDLDTAWQAEYEQLVQYVTDSTTVIDGLVTQAQDAATAAAASEAQAATYAQQAGNVTDTAMTAVFNNLSSAFRAATNAAYAAKSLEGTVTALTTTVAAKADTSYVDSHNASQDTTIAGNTSGIAALNTLTTTGRLGQTALDSRYFRVPTNVHAVMLGSSQSVAGTTWVESFASLMNYTMHNYSVGGGGFTATGSAQYIAQANAAIADSSYDHSLVKYVFICDMGNDIRATNPVDTTSPAVFAALRTAFPQARIILIPVIWGNDSVNNNISGRLVSISQRFQEVRNAAIPFDIEFIEWTETWFADSTTWLKPGEVHLATNGLTRMVQFMQKYMNGESTKYDLGWSLVPPASGVDPGSAYWRVARQGDIAHLENQFTITADMAVDTNLGQLSYGVWPIDTVMVPAVNLTNRSLYTMAVYGAGLVRTFGAMPAATYKIDSSWRVF